MIGSGGVRGRLPASALLSRALRSTRTAAAVVAVLAAGALGWLWYRGSSFVRIERVTVTGLAGPAVPQIRDALTVAALRMTTLDISPARLEAAVVRYPYVQSVAVTASGAHSVVIHVAEQVPLAFVQDGAHRAVVDANGRLLAASAVVHLRLPVLELASAPVGGAISAAGARAALAVLAAAPYPVIPHIANATWSAAHGVIVQLRNGPQLYFGPDTEPQRKWRSALVLLQSKAAAGASYIVVTDPVHPAAGAGVSPSQAAALGLATTAPGG